jgi:hypothetical protein
VGSLCKPAPASPMLNIEPTLPMLKMDPVLPMLRIDPALPMLKIEPALPILKMLPKLTADCTVIDPIVSAAMLISQRVSCSSATEPMV